MVVVAVLKNGKIASLNDRHNLIQVLFYLIKPQLL